MHLQGEHGVKGDRGDAGSSDMGNEAYYGAKVRFSSYNVHYVSVSKVRFKLHALI